MEMGAAKMFGYCPLQESLDPTGSVAVYKAPSLKFRLLGSELALPMEIPVGSW